MSRRRIRGILTFLAIGAAVVVATPLRRPPGPPSIVLVSIDTLRADHVSAYGYSRPTPHLDALAAEGVLYEEARSAASWTLPSHMSLFTGRYPSRHGVVDEDRRLGADVETLAEVLERHGYRCAAVVSHALLDARFGFDRGFGERFSYRQYRNPGTGGSSAVRGDVAIEGATRFLEEARGDGRPFFLFVHLFDPHWTYGAPEPFRGRYTSGYDGSIDGTIGSIVGNIDGRRRRIAPEDLRHLVDLYDEEIAWADHLLGVLVDRVRAMPGGDRTILVVTSDHGEEFSEHGSLGHATTLFREVTHVPLIVVDPASGRRGLRISQPVSGVDVAPTLAHLAGVDPGDPFLAGLDGRPLPHEEERGEPRARALFMETTRWGPPRQAVLLDPLEYVGPSTYDWIGRLRIGGAIEDRVVASWSRPEALYRLDRDPGQQEPLTLESAGSDGIPVLEAHRRWRDLAWRGVLLEIESDGPWRGRVTVGDGARWWDEPQLSTDAPGPGGTRELDVVDGSVEVLLPDAGSYRVHLPVRLSGAGRLTLEVLEGAIHFDHGGGSALLAAGEELSVETSSGPSSPLGVDRFPVVRLSTRPHEQEGSPVHDPEALRVLESLGYLGR